MPQFAPIVKWPYTDEERAIAGGYLLYRRHGLLQALGSVARADEISVDGYFIKTHRYYTIAEAWNRFELYWIGYEVAKGQLYNP